MNDFLILKECKVGNAKALTVAARCWRAIKYLVSTSNEHQQLCEAVGGGKRKEF